MKSAIIFYSLTGNTEKVAEILADCLKQASQVDIIKLEALDESKSFFKQCLRAATKKKANIENVNFDLSNYDLICFGTPVWAFAPVPAINTYLDKCSGLESKDVILFSTYGSGTGKEKCLNYMQNILGKKGAKGFKRFSIQQFKVDNKELVSSTIKELGLRL